MRAIFWGLVSIELCELLQVREAAAITLGGFLHCGYLKMGKELMVCYMGSLIILCFRRNQFLSMIIVTYLK